MTAPPTGDGVAEPRSLRRLHGGTGPAVLAVDFGRTRTEAGFRDLVPILALDVPVYECVPPGLHGTPLVDTSVDAYVGTWSAEVGRLGLDVRAVLGYCSGGPLAGSLARALGQDASVVTFDLTPVTGELLAAEFSGRLDDYRPLLDDDQRAAVEAETVRLHGCPTDRAATAVTAAANLFASVSRPALGRLGVLPAVADDLVTRVVAWLRYLGAASQAPAPPAGAAAIWSRTASESDAQSGIRIPAPRADLLRDERTAAALRHLLDPAGAPEPATF